MKKILFFALTALAVLVFVTTNVTPSSAGTLDSSNSTTEEINPYDFINSKGEVIKYSDIQKKAKISSELNTKPTPGNGKVFPKQTLTKDPNKLFKNIGTGSIIEENDTGIGINGVIGADGRKKVTNTTANPYKKIAYVETSWTDGYGMCTGTVIAENAILTAAHCVYDIVDKESTRGGVVIPAVANNSYQYGAYIIEDYYYPAAYRNFNNADNQPAINYDYAILVVDTFEGHEIGDVVGTLPIKQVGQTIKGTSVKVYGYPGDLIGSTGIYDQYGMSGSITDEVVEIAYYTLDTFGGQSGAAILNASNQIIGVHSSGWHDGNFNYLYNGGGKMSSHMATFIRSFQ